MLSSVFGFRFSVTIHGQAATQPAIFSVSPSGFLPGINP
jgi:hypothetical protein